MAAEYKHLVTRRIASNGIARGGFNPKPSSTAILIMINEVHRVIDGLFESCCKRMRAMPTNKLQDLAHEAHTESSIAESQIRKTAAHFVYRCAEAVLDVRKGR